MSGKKIETHPEDLSGRAAAAEREDGVPEGAAALGHRGRILEAHLLKCAEGVRRQDLRPLVAEVPRGIAARKDVAESAEEPAHAQSFLMMLNVFVAAREYLAEAAQEPACAQSLLMMLNMFTSTLMHVAAN